MSLNGKLTSTQSLEFLASISNNLMFGDKYLPDSFEWRYYLIVKNIQINIVIGGYRLRFSKTGIHKIVLASQI